MKVTINSRTTGQIINVRRRRHNPRPGRPSRGKKAVDPAPAAPPLPPSATEPVSPPKKCRCWNAKACS